VESEGGSNGRRHFGVQAIFKQQRQQLKRILEAGDRHVRDAGGPAVLNQTMLGKHEVDAIGGAFIILRYSGLASRCF